MLSTKRDFFVARISAGYYKIKLNRQPLYIFPANQEVEYEACELFNEVYDDAYNSGLLTLEESYEILRRRDLWTERNESDLSKIPDNIDILKMELYRAAFKSNTRKRIREHLEITKKEYERLLGLKNCLQQYTCLGLANYAKWNYIIENTTFFHDGKSYDWKDFSVHHVLSEYNKQILLPDQIRELAHTEPWYNVWAIKKKNGQIFPEPWTVEQKTLVSWSMLYDNVYECPEAPGQSVIDDDDMLDGWLIIKRKERESEQSKKQGEEAISQNQKIANAGEIFIPVERPEDAQSVYNLNDARAEHIRKRRLAQIAEQGSVKHGHLKDVVADAKMQAQQAYLEKMRKR